MVHRLRPKEFIVAPADRDRRGARGSGTPVFPAHRSVLGVPQSEAASFIRRLDARLGLAVIAVRDRRESPAPFRQAEEERHDRHRDHPPPRRHPGQSHGPILTDGLARLDAGLPLTLSCRAKGRASSLVYRSDLAPSALLKPTFYHLALNQPRPTLSSHVRPLSMHERDGR